jgi:hypothetical protein
MATRKDKSRSWRCMFPNKGLMVIMPPDYVHLHITVRTGCAAGARSAPRSWRRCKASSSPAACMISTPMTTLSMSSSASTPTPPPMSSSSSRATGSSASATIRCAQIYMPSGSEQKRRAVAGHHDLADSLRLGRTGSEQAFDRVVGEKEAKFPTCENGLYYSQVERSGARAYARSRALPLKRARIDESHDITWFARASAEAQQFPLCTFGIDGDR